MKQQKMLPNQSCTNSLHDFECLKATFHHVTNAMQESTVTNLGPGSEPIEKIT